MLRIKWNKIRSFICRRHISHLRGKYFTSKIFYSFRRNEFYWKDLNLCKKYLWTSMVLWHLLLYCLIKTQVKYPADAGCEMFALRQTWNIAPSSQCEIKFARVRAANISRELSHFTRRRHISHLRSKYFTSKIFYSFRRNEFHWKRHLQLIAVLNKTTISFSEIARFAHGEIIYFVNCEIWCCASSEIKFVPSYAAGIFHICEANISHRRYFTRFAGTNFTEKTSIFAKNIFEHLWCFDTCFCTA